MSVCTENQEESIRHRNCKAISRSNYKTWKNNRGRSFFKTNC